jgi:hypothetical protein
MPSHATLHARRLPQVSTFTFPHVRPLCRRWRHNHRRWHNRRLACFLHTELRSQYDATAMSLTRHFQMASNAWSTVGRECPLNKVVINADKPRTNSDYGCLDSVRRFASASICPLTINPQLSFFPPTSLAHYSKLPHSQSSFLLRSGWFLFYGTHSLPASSSAPSSWPEVLVQHL